jgi:hypothetical protein
MQIEQKDNIQIFGHVITGKQLYFLGFIIYFLPSFLSNTMFSATISGHQLRLLSYIALPFLLLKIFLIDKWETKQLVLIVFSFVISLVIWRKTQNANFVFACPLIVGAKGIDFKQIISWFLYLSVVCLLLTISFSLVGIIPNLIYYSPSRPTRYALGMAYATYAATIYLYIVLAYCYLRFGSLKVYDYVAIIFIDWVIMLLTNTRLDFYAVFILIIAMEFAQQASRGKRVSQICSSFFWMATPILSVLTICASYFYDSSNHILYKLNTLFSGRLMYGHMAFQRYNVNFLGRKIVEHSYSGFKGHSFQNSPWEHLGISYFFVDSSYVRMLLLWGCIAFIIVVVSMTIIAIRSTANRSYALAAIMMIVAINCMFEPYIIYFVYNPFLLALFAKKEISIPSGGQNEQSQANTFRS